MMNGVTKQLKFITIWVFLIHIRIKVKLSEQDFKFIKKSKEELLKNKKTEILKLEIEEKKMVLKEYAIKAQIAEVEIRKLEAETKVLE
ncbi:hypothetical protein RhiirA4_478612 [Rhizophagus irregularis]|uniref:Uncharacterized protein n=1 Tax=Rhizophagus irregularis TaxID=588596 RepID=A0A2I1HF33_9GLOM|nr:hypothetical protein RhiirA4_478612 [Rhizophagus irregularis]